MLYQSTHNYKTCIKELCVCVERGVQSLTYQNNACFQKHVLNNKGRRTQNKDHSELFLLLIYLNLQFLTAIIGCLQPLTESEHHMSSINSTDLTKNKQDKNLGSYANIL